MSSLPSRDEIFIALKDMVIEALRIKPEDVKPESRFFIDLNAESIDILDIRFRIQQKYKFEIEHEDIIKYIGMDITAEQFKERFTVESLVIYIEFRLTGQANAK